MAQPEPGHLWDAAYAVDASEKKATGHLLKLQAEHHQDALRVAQRLHRNLGHASVVSAAKEYKCVPCLKHKKPNTKWLRYHCHNQRASTTPSRPTSSILEASRSEILSPQHCGCWHEIHGSLPGVGRDLRVLCEGPREGLIAPLRSSSHFGHRRRKAMVGRHIRKLDQRSRHRSSSRPWRGSRETCSR